MKILIGHKGNVDFDEPIKMTNEQKEKFIHFMTSMFFFVEEDVMTMLRKDRVGSRAEWPRDWSEEELALLYDLGKDTNEISEILGRTWMSVDLKRGDFIVDFQKWLSEKGFVMKKVEDVKDLIDKFLKEKEKIKIKKRLDKKEFRDRLKEIENLESNKITFKKIISIGLPWGGVTVKIAKSKLKEIERKIKLLEEKQRLEQHKN